MAGEAVKIKGTKQGLVILFDPDLDIEEVKNNLKTKIENSNGFFKGAKCSVCDFHSGRQHRYVDELEGICRQYGLVPSPEVCWPPSGGAARAAHLPTGKGSSRVIPLRQQPAGGDGEQVLLVTKILRSGQRLASRHSIVIMADVNPGAEVISEGSIYVLGTCNGIVHAGCNGDILAEVYAMELDPVILRIGTISAAPSVFEGIEGPATARVSRGEIVAVKM